MITKEQIDYLDLLLGKIIRLAQYIEWKVKCIYATCVPDVNTSINKIFEYAENLSFNDALMTLEKLDEKHKIFNSFQYSFLHSIKKRRNKFCHKMDCRYFDWKGSFDKQQEEYEQDIKKLKRCLSDCQQQAEAIKKKFDKMVSFENIPCPPIIITDIKTYKF